jgi:hypothetical protein
MSKQKQINNLVKEINVRVGYRNRVYEMKLGLEREREICLVAQVKVT